MRNNSILKFGSLNFSSFGLLTLPTHHQLWPKSKPWPRNFLPNHDFRARLPLESSLQWWFEGETPKNFSIFSRPLKTSVFLGFARSSQTSPVCVCRRWWIRWRNSYRLRLLVLLRPSLQRSEPYEGESPIWCHRCSPHCQSSLCFCRRSSLLMLIVRSS